MYIHQVREDKNLHEEYGGFPESYKFGNTIIRQKNGGVLDKTFPIPWDEYRNSLLLTNENDLNVIPTRIYSIIDIKSWEKDRKI